MGFINLLKNGYRGKLGETVGQQWKNQLTVRTYQATNNSKSEAQLKQRENYKNLSKGAAQYYQSTFNLIVPKKKAMNKFNFFTSNIMNIIENLNKNKLTLQLGDYRYKNILSPWGGTRDNAIWAYVILPYGEPPKSGLSIPQSIIFGMKDNGNVAPMPDGILSQEIIPKKPKAGATPYPFPRGYFVKTKMTPGSRDIFLIALGKKEKGYTKWSEVTMIQPVFPIEDDQLEDI